MYKQNKYIIILILVLFLVSLDIYAQEWKTELKEISLTESDMSHGYKLQDSHFWKDRYLGPKVSKNTLYQGWEIDDKDDNHDTRISITYVYSNNITESIIDINLSREGGSGVFYLGSYVNRIIGDFSWLTEPESIIFVKNNIGINIFCHSKSYYTPSEVAEKIISKIDNNMSDDMKQKLEEKRNILLSEDRFAKLVPEKLNKFNKQESVESKWVVSESDFVLGRRVTWVNDDGRMIGIDITECKTKEEADSAIKYRQNITKRVSKKLEKPLNPQLPSKIWINEFSLGFPSLVYTHGKFAVQIFKDNPYVRGDSSKSVDTLLFDIAQNVGKNINF